MIQLIKSNGDVTDNFTADTLKKKQDAVKSGSKAGSTLIQVVPTPVGKVLIVNEEGRMLGLKKNEQATRIAGQDLFGDVICLDQEDYHNFLN